MLTIYFQLNRITFELFSKKCKSRLWFKFQVTADVRNLDDLNVSRFDYTRDQSNQIPYIGVCVKQLDNLDFFSFTSAYDLNMLNIKRSSANNSVFENWLFPLLSSNLKQRDGMPDSIRRPFKRSLGVPPKPTRVRKSVYNISSLFVENIFHQSFIRVYRK